MDSPVHTLYTDLDSSDWGETSVVEFGSRPSLPLVGRRAVGSFLDRLEYAFWTPPAEYDVIVSSGLVAKTVQHRPDQTRIHLAHGFHRGAFGLPPRDEFASNRLLRFLQQTNRLSLRRSERQDAQQMDYLIVNSEFTKSIVEHYLGATVDRVIHPPVSVESYEDDRPADEDFFLFLGRVAAVKGVEQIVEAFEELPYQLRVAGDGPLREELQSQSGDNVEFPGYVSEERKRELMGKCQGFIQNSVIEDFGITTVEAMASGAPVVAVNHQNNPYLVEDGDTGILFEPSKSVEPLREGVRAAAATDWDHEHIQESATPYSEAHCRQKWKQLLADAHEPT
ncbi:glycosyltransferase [Halapricum sp. CBA1109]|uniref:glycosyltransferase n=1 Tax=Halapricum sp. CBA1109 TaxID=2668068 RepID=UPI0018D25043|nr:glycosyltransferase [Halapricum sp. CBA1109]